MVPLAQQISRTELVSKVLVPVEKPFTPVGNPTLPVSDPSVHRELLMRERSPAGTEAVRPQSRKKRLWNERPVPLRFKIFADFDGDLVRQCIIKLARLQLFADVDFHLICKQRASHFVVLYDRAVSEVSSYSRQIRTAAGW